MQDFIYHNPVKILFGHDQIPALAQEVPQDKKVMIVYGGGSVIKHGILQRVKGSLKNTLVFEFGGVEPNPHYETLMKAVEIVKAEKIDFLLAVGGGSVIDGTKFIAAAALYENDPWEIITSYGSVVKQALPFGCVLTLAATGSEMNNTAVINRATTQDKLFFASPCVMPQFSVLEPEITYTLPERQTANGVVDAFVHILEQYITYPVNAKVQDRLAEGLLNTLKEEGPTALKNPQDYDARANIMWAATMALNGMLSAGVPTDWASHIVVRDHFAVHIPENITFQEAAPLLCAGITTYSPLMKAGIVKGMKVGVAGIGGLGHMAIKLAVSKGAEVYAFTTTPSKVDDILSFGAKEVIVVDSSDKLKAYQGSLDYMISTIPYQFDVAAYASVVKPYGTFTQVGMPEGFQITLNALGLAASRVNFNASMIGGMKETQEVVNYCSENKILPTIQIIKAEQINEAWDNVFNKKARYRYVIDASTM